MIDEPIYRETGTDFYPEDEAGWFDVYQRRENTYLYQPYSATTAKHEHLFRAFNLYGNEIDATKRVWGYYQFITDVDAGALAPSGLILEEAKETTEAAWLPVGEAIWTRCNLDTELPHWALQTCKLGDYWLEVQRRSDGAYVIVGHDPQCIKEIVYDSTGTLLEHLVIEIDQMDRPLVTRGQGAPDAVIHKIRRILTPTTITVEVDGRVDPARSGRNPLGYVPAVQLRAIRGADPAHSLPAAHGVERAVMQLDSHLTQTRAVGHRVGNPILMFKGAKIEAGAGLGELGRVVSGVPADGDGKYIEPTMSAIAEIRNQMEQLAAHLREKSPEFLFSDSGAAESGEARAYRAILFEMKIGMMRKPWYNAVCRVIQMAACLTIGKPYTPDERYYMIDAPPVLPVNRAKEVELLMAIKPELRRADLVRHLQRLGFIPADVDPEEYAAEAADEGAARATAFMTEPVTQEQVDQPGESEDSQAARADEAAAALSDLADRLEATDPEAARAIRDALLMLEDEEDSEDA